MITKVYHYLWSCIDAIHFFSVTVSLFNKKYAIEVVRNMFFFLDAGAADMEMMEDDADVADDDYDGDEDMGPIDEEGNRNMVIVLYCKCSSQVPNKMLLGPSVVNPMELKITMALISIRKQQPKGFW